MQQSQQVLSIFLFLLFLIFIKVITIVVKRYCVTFSTKKRKKEKDIYCVPILVNNYNQAVDAIKRLT